jgi:hypothetical protein
MAISALQSENNGCPKLLPVASYFLPGRVRVGRKNVQLGPQNPYNHSVLLLADSGTLVVVLCR